MSGSGVENTVTGPLLETKFRIPARRRGLVARARLTERLGHAGESALTLVSAPAGFGKTTLLTDWLTVTRGGGRTTAWLSLDDGDNDPSLFWAYCIAALRTAAPGVGAGALALLASAGSPTEAFVVTLLNDLAAVSDEVVVVLDDYHVIEETRIRDGMAFLVEHLPPQIRLVIATRADPAMPLARLRARGELVEIRAADLRFTLGEATAYLNEVMGLRLAPGDIAALEGRTEGWIAALQLAALSMQGRDDVAGFIAGFGGDDRYIVDYLVGEVLERQPEPVRRFLLLTSILSGLNGSLCDAVTGDDGGRMLEALDRGNLFLVPLDDRRLWYRYHHLFADVLRARLRDEQPDQVHELHRRASDWYARNGDESAAISHALDGEHFERAADLIEMAARPAFRARREATFRRWLEALPEELFPVRPVLAIALVAAHMVRGDIEGVESRLQDIEHCLEATAAPNGAGVASTVMVVNDHEEFRRLPNQIAVYRAGIALIRGDTTGTIAYARRALELATEDDHLGHGSAAALLALAHWTQGDLEAAHHWYAQALPRLEKAGHLSDALGLSLALADVLIAQGRLGDAMSTYRARPEGRGRAGVAGLEGYGGHARRDERPTPRAQRSRRGPPAPPAQHGARGTRWPPPERLPVAGRVRPGYVKPKETWPVPRTCLTKPSASTSATTRPRCGPSQRSGPGFTSRRARSVTHSAGRVSGTSRLRTRSATSTSSSTSPWPRSSSPSTPRGEPADRNLT